MLARREDSVLVLVDMQPSFLRPIHGAEAITQRCAFLLEIAALLGVPAIATEQNPARMGGTETGLSDILDKIGVRPISKMTFCCACTESFMTALKRAGKSQVVLAGIETHICVNQTAHHLIDEGLEVLLCADAVSSRTVEMNEIGLRRVASYGAVVAHGESIAYEWLGTAEDPAFKSALEIVKRYA